MGVEPPGFQWVFCIGKPWENIWENTFNVGGFKDVDDFPCHIWDVNLPIDELIFFKMVKTTNQTSTNGGSKRRNIFHRAFPLPCLIPISVCGLAFKTASKSGRFWLSI